MDLEVGQVIADRYFINRLVGRGRLGHVYEARDSARGGRVAIRVLHPALDTLKVAAFNDRDAKATGRLGNAHVNEPVRIEFLLSGERCIVSPFLDGEALERTLLRVGVLPPNAVVTLLAQVLDGLAVAHDVGVIHRDLTPRSILIVPASPAPGALAKLIDFGISRLKAARADLTGSSQCFELDESFRYLSPEQLEGSSELDGRCNVYSLGVIAFRALSGRLPEGPACDREDLDALFPQVEPTLVGVIRRAMAASPSERFQSARDMLEALSTLPQGDLGVLIEEQKQGAEPGSTERTAIVSTEVEPKASEGLDGLSDVASEDAVTGQKLAFVPPPPLHAVDAQLAASQALNETQLAPSVGDEAIESSDSTHDPTAVQSAEVNTAPDVPNPQQVHAAAGVVAVVESPYRSRQSTAPGIHPDDDTGGASAERGPVSVPSAAEPASSQIPTTNPQRLSERPAEAPTTSLPRVGSTARATSSPTRVTKGTRAAPLTRLTPSGSPSTAPRARPKVELAAPAAETPDIAQPSSGRSRLPLVLSILFLGLAALGIVFFLLPGRNVGQVETKNDAGNQAQAKLPSVPQPAAASLAGTSPAQGSDGPSSPGPTSQPVAGATAMNSGAATPPQSRDKSPVTAQPAQSKVSGAKKQTSNLPAKKSPSIRSKDPYNYR